MSILSAVGQRQLPALVLKCSDELLTGIRYCATIKTPKKAPIFTGPREETAPLIYTKSGQGRNQGFWGTRRSNNEAYNLNLSLPLPPSFPLSPSLPTPPPSLAMGERHRHTPTTVILQQQLGWNFG